jgi:DNA replicative helicase MCM subunit Mcm2 (Cdc46/Mcm family)
VLYRGFLSMRPDENQQIIRRGDAQTLRLSLIFAVLNRSPVIRAEHVRAAIAVWDYCMKSARWAFVRD